MICPKCGMFLVGSSKVCDMCGTPIDVQNLDSEGNTGELKKTESVGAKPAGTKPQSKLTMSDPSFQSNSGSMRRRYPNSPVENTQPAPAPKKTSRPPKPPKKGFSKGTKIFLLVVLVLVAVLVVAGMMNNRNKKSTNNGSGGTSSQEKSTTQRQATEKATEKSTSVALSSKSKSSDYKVEYVSHSIEKNYDGKDVLVIEYAFTNNSEKEKSFTFACADQVFQNGIECSSVSVMVDGVDSGKEMLDIKPGTTFNLKVGYILHDKTNALVEVTDLTGRTMLLQKTIDLGGGEGSWSANAGTSAETSVKIIDSFLSNAHDGTDVLVIKYEIFNGEDSNLTFSAFFDDKVYQNGVECSDLVYSEDVDSTAAISSIKPGVTLVVSEGYKLTDKSDVEVEVKKLFSDKVYCSQTIKIQ